MANEHGTDSLRLLFADVVIEDADCYRFLIEGAANIFGINRPRKIQQLCNKARALPPLNKIQWRKWALIELSREVRRVIPGLVWISEGRTPWDVFRDVRFIGNSRVDPCSKILKRDFLDRWMDANCDSESTIQYFGLDANEEHRFESLKRRRFGWTIKAPLIEKGIFKEFIEAELAKEGIKQSRSYDAGFAHDNCSNTCIKAGQAQWEKTLRLTPLTFNYAENEERRTMVHIGRDDIGVLRDRRGGETKRISLATFRERVHAGEKVDKFDWGGCGCAIE